MNARTRHNDELDTAIRSVLADIVSATDHTSQIRDHSTSADDSPGGPWRGWLSVAAAAILVVGVGALVVVGQRTPADAPAATVTLPTDAGPAASTPQADTDRAPDPPAAGPLADVGDIEIEQAFEEGQDPPWDDVMIAPGTPTWFDIATADLPASLRDVVGERDAWTDAYTSIFYRCVSWRVDNGRPVCDRLTGANYGNVRFGETVTLGSALTDAAPAELLWELANGSLWGYDTYDTPPTPTPVSVGAQNDGLTYQQDDVRYTVWTEQPGSLAWVKTTGLDDSQITSLTESVQPVSVDQLPVLLSISPATGDPIPHDRQVKLGWVDGRPCVGINMWDRCTPADQGPALITGETSNGRGPSIAAITPAESNVSLVVDLFEIGEQPVAPTPSGFGFDIALFASDTERLLGGRLVDDQGASVLSREFGLESISNGFGPDLIAEGRTDGGRAWIVLRQDPATERTGESSEYGNGGYCWLLFEGTEGFAPLCPPPSAPSSGLGYHADYHDELDLIEVAGDVDTVECNGSPLPIHTDPQLDNRRFVVSSCDQPTSTLIDGQPGPFTPAGESPPLDNPDNCPTYTIVAGDYPAALADEFGVTVDELIGFNQHMRVEIGEEIVIPC